MARSESPCPVATEEKRASAAPPVDGSAGSRDIRTMNTPGPALRRQQHRRMLSRTRGVDR